MQRPQRDNNFAQKRQFFKSMDPSLQNKNTFLSLLPPHPHPHPPPSRTSISKILPPNLAKTSPVKVMVSSVNQESTQSSLDEPQRDDYEWINKISEAIKKPIQVSRTHFYGGNKSVYTLFPQSHIDISSPFKASSSSTTTCSGVRVAPAVQIRSVVPVCAAPPVRPRPAPSNQPSSSSTTAEVVAATLSKLKL